MRRLSQVGLLLVAACATAPVQPPAPQPMPSEPGVSAGTTPERIVFDRINQERRGRGCAALEWSDAAARAAEAHSADMARRGYFSHVSPDGSQPGQRLTAAGATWTAVAENIAFTGAGAADAVRLWMGSPGHRDNILDCRYTHTGIGESSGRWTQLFYRP